MAITTTIGSGQDLTTVEAWAAYLSGRSFTDDEHGVVHGTVTDTNTVSITGFTPNGFLAILEAASGQGVSAGGRAWRLTSGRATLAGGGSYSGGYDFSSTSLVVRDLQIETSNANASYVATLGGATIDRCIVYHPNATTPAVRGSGAGGTIRSSLVIVGSGTACKSIGNLTCERVTAVSTNGSGTGFSSDYSGLKANGCIAYNCTTAYAGTAASGSSHNATGSGTFSGTGWGTSGQVSVASGDFVDTGSGTEDFRPASGSTKLVDTGAAISGLSVDLFGTSVPQGSTEDIGAVEVSAGGPDTTPPVITVPGNSAGATTATLSVAENTTACGTITADESVTWSLNGGADAAAFTINSTTGALAFASAPDFEAPTDTGGDNTYVVVVRATDGSSNTADVTITVTVTDVADTPGTLVLNALKFGDMVGGAIGTIALDAGGSWRAEVRAASDTQIGSLVLADSSARTLNGSGSGYPNMTDLAIVTGTDYDVFFTRQSDGKRVQIRATAT